jgi:predicted MFS family arabinose efflux permease
LLGLAALIIGVAYGPVTPASSHLLQRTAAPSRMAVTFSIKQTGVPAGVALCGAFLPALALTLGWRIAFALVAIAGAVVVVLAQPIRPALDTDLRAHRGVSLASMFSPLALLRTTPGLLDLAVVSFAYSATQVCLTSFLVVHLTETLQWTLVGAGFALTAATVGGVFGRIGWCYVADRLLAPRRVLMLVGVLAAAFGTGIALAPAATSHYAVVPLAFAFGATAIGWNGVQLAEVARLAPPGSAGKVTGASGFVTFAGVVIGPPAFALLSSFTGSYRTGFATFAAVSIAGALTLLRRAAVQQRTPAA